MVESFANTSSSSTSSIFLAVYVSLYLVPALVDSWLFYRTEQYVSRNGQFTLTSNASASGNLDNVQGAFYTGINPNRTVQHAVLSVVMQSSSQSVFDRSFVCFAVADNFTDLSLYVCLPSSHQLFHQLLTFFQVPADLAPTDSILYNVTLLFPQSLIPSRVDSFTTVLPLFDQQFSSFDGNVIFDKVSITGSVSRVTVGVSDSHGWISSSSDAYHDSTCKPTTY